MGIDHGHLQEYVLGPAARLLGIGDSPEARALLAGTVAVESAGGRWLHQKQGPAIGIFQMEPATHDDIWNNYIAHRPQAFIRIERRHPEAMHWDLRYSAIMARIHYLRVPEPLPLPSDVEGMGLYWKNHYNTLLGAGTVAKFVKAYREYTEGG